MLRFVARHGLVRLVAGRAVPALLIWDLAVLANRVRRVPAVDRGLRRGVGATRRTLETISARPRLPTRRSRLRRPRPPWTPEPTPAATPDTDA